MQTQTTLLSHSNVIPSQFKTSSYCFRERESKERLENPNNQDIYCIANPSWTEAGSVMGMGLEMGPWVEGSLVALHHR